MVVVRREGEVVVVVVMLYAFSFAPADGAKDRRGHRRGRIGRVSAAVEHVVLRRWRERSSPGLEKY